MFITVGPVINKNVKLIFISNIKCIKAVSGGRERGKGGHVLRDTTSRSLYVRVWPPHTSRGGGGGCEQEGWQGGARAARAVYIYRPGGIPLW